MNTQKPINSSAPPESVKDNQPHSSGSQTRSLVPKGITIGMAVFALVLSLAGYGFRLLVGDDVQTVLRHDRPSNDL